MKTNTAMAVFHSFCCPSLITNTNTMETNTAVAVSRFLSIVDKAVRMKTNTAVAVFHGFCCPLLIKQ